MNIPHLKTYSKSDILSLTKLRRFETKLGERVSVLNSNNPEDLRNLDANYVVVGIPEDIGIQANLGVGGASTAWLCFFYRLSSIYKVMIL